MFFPTVTTDGTRFFPVVLPGPAQFSGSLVIFFLYSVPRVVLQIPAFSMLDWLSWPKNMYQYSGIPVFQLTEMTYFCEFFFYKCFKQFFYWSTVGCTCTAQWIAILAWDTRWNSSTKSKTRYSNIFLDFSWSGIHKHLLETFLFSNYFHEVMYSSRRK